jgi:hypothetical protein
MQGWPHYKQAQTPRPSPQPGDRVAEPFPCSFECLEQKRKRRLVVKTILSSGVQHKSGGLYVS